MWPGKQIGCRIYCLLNRILHDELAYKMASTQTNEPQEMKWVYTFEEGSQDMRPLLGGKGANLAEMVQHNLPVPPGFVITTEACNAYLKDRQVPSDLWTQVQAGIRQIETKTNKQFGHRKQPLTVSVRSGAPVSMPGMMDTIPNIGLNDTVVEGLAKLTNDSWFAYDSYRRLIQMFANVVVGISNEPFKIALENICNRAGVKTEAELNVGQLKDVTEECKRIFERESGQEFPQDPKAQLQQAIMAVFESWTADKAVEYRELYGIPESLGTGVAVQAMVFGNWGNNSGTGVVFTRDPASGEKRLFGEYLRQAQGEAIVAGTRTPQPIEKFAQDFPQPYHQLTKLCAQLEAIFKDLQDVEFTVEQGQLWLLQTRAGKRTPQAAVKVAVDMVNEGILSREDAISQVEPSFIGHLLSPRFEDVRFEDAAAKGIGSSPGAAVGRIALDREQVRKLSASSEPIIFVSENISADDVPVMAKAAGILTQHGGATAHAAVVARGQGKPCVVGCETLHIDLQNKQVLIHIDRADNPDNKTIAISQGDYISIDGNTGLVFVGKKKLTGTSFKESNELITLLEWADEINERKTLGDIVKPTQIWINADTPAEVEFAQHQNIKGVGLCRTEWMFNDVPFRTLFRQMFLAGTEADRMDATEQLQRLQAHIYKSIFEYADNLPITIRLLSAPIDDFLPVRDAVVTELAELRWSEGWNETIGQKEQLLKAINALQQINPRFGVRGVRYFFAMPALAKMQVKALFEGLSAVKGQNAESRPNLRILLPTVSSAEEIKQVISVIRKESINESFSYQVGALIETPRAALTAGEIARCVDFLCLGTDGLTENVYGYGREDGNKFISPYVSQRILPDDPLMWFDEAGVGAMMRLAVQQARETRPEIEIGIYGTHVHNADAIRFYNRLNLDYVSCDLSQSLYLRLALARAKMDTT